MIRAMVIMILAGLTFLQGYLPDGMAYNPTPESHYEFGGMARNPFAYEFCPELYCPKPTPRQHRSATPEPTIEATPEPTPTEESWTCPILGDSTKKEYRAVCIESCELTGQVGCAGICNQCRKESE